MKSVSQMQWHKGPGAKYSCATGEHIKDRIAIAFAMSHQERFQAISCRKPLCKRHAPYLSHTRQIFVTIARWRVAALYLHIA
jgi:hypothetical protein